VKIVLDTNVILSSFLTEGIAHRIFNHCIINHKVYVSDYILNELVRILTKKFLVNEKDLEEFINFIKSNLNLTIPDISIPEICRDKKDNQILQLSEYVSADIIISGDKDLLILKSYRKTKITSPRDFFNKHMSDLV
jgi:uncharacterized protein